MVPSFTLTKADTTAGIVARALILSEHGIYSMILKAGHGASETYELHVSALDQQRAYRALINAGIRPR